MISDEQKELAAYVKEVHLSLRCRAQEIGAEKAWQEHLQNEQVLKKYAYSMKKLSEEYWSVNNRSVANVPLCRNIWMSKYVKEYFGMNYEREIQKELKKMNLFKQKELFNLTETSKYETFESVDLPKPPYKVLDVGSCHNPLKEFDFLDVYPIDICPGVADVKKFNFIEAKVGQGADTRSWFEAKNINELPSCYFDVVVFSLFLEYLPSPKQRFLACLNAYKCLKINGLLLIVTPDSKHASANSGIMKNWKIAAACLGFNRTRLEKLKYLYCMAFRKSISSQYPLLLYNICAESNNPAEMFIIPQDFVDYNVSDKVSKEKSGNDESIHKKVIFNELPFPDT